MTTPSLSARRGRRISAVRLVRVGAGGRCRDVGMGQAHWRCTHLECEQQTWTESHPEIRPRAAWTERARKQARRRVGRDGHSVADFGRAGRGCTGTWTALIIDNRIEVVKTPSRVVDEPLI
jgi:hypothetical protein